MKPIQPEKHYLEARLNSGDRIVFRIEGETVFFVDVVKHDDIERYGRRLRAGDRGDEAPRHLEGAEMTGATWGDQTLGALVGLAGAQLTAPVRQTRM